jgi:hypothetical protein
MKVVRSKTKRRIRLIRRKPGSRRLRELLDKSPKMTEEQRSTVVRLLTRG